MHPLRLFVRAFVPAAALAAGDRRRRVQRRERPDGEPNKNLTVAVATLSSGASPSSWADAPWRRRSTGTSRRPAVRTSSSSRGRRFRCRASSSSRPHATSCDDDANDNDGRVVLADDHGSGGRFRRRSRRRTRTPTTTAARGSRRPLCSSSFPSTIPSCRCSRYRFPPARTAGSRRRSMCPELGFRRPRVPHGASAIRERECASGGIVRRCSIRVHGTREREPRVDLRSAHYGWDGAHHRHRAREHRSLVHRPGRPAHRSVHR